MGTLEPPSHYEELLRKISLTTSEKNGGAFRGRYIFDETKFLNTK